MENLRHRVSIWSAEFIALCESRGYSIHTVRKYRRILVSLQEHLAANPAPDLAAAVEAWTVTTYAIKKRMNAASMVSHVATFAKWVFDGGRVDRRPIVCYKRPATQPKGMPLALIKRFRADLDKDTRFMLRFLLDTALRIGAARSLTRESFDLETMAIYAISKGNKLHKVTVGKRLTPEVRRRVLKLAAGERLFPDTYAAYYGRFYRASKRVKIHVTPHLLRHSFARHFCLSGGREPVLQRVLGHSTPDQSMRYASVYSDDAIAQQHALSPVDRMEG